MLTRELLESMGAILSGHFVFASGLHSNTYINKDAVLVRPRLLNDVAKDIVAHSGPDIQTVVAPEKGGIKLVHAVAQELCRLMESEIFSPYAERGENDRFYFKREHGKFVAGYQVLVVEDVITTGTTVRSVIDAVRELGGTVVGVGVICNRGKETAQTLGVPWLYSVLQIPLPNWEAILCPLCLQRMPVNTEVGHGWKFVA
ncbi:phosphoribosyltransferase [Patescibacteria group bacterium]|nr:phosphoribosyltransferase [Patescibacteria group bacterium]